MTENQHKEKAFKQYQELYQILKSSGILDMTNKDDFVSKVWGLANYTPRIVDNNLIDLDYKNITATLDFYGENPELLAGVEYFVGGDSEDWYEFEFNFIEKE